MTGTLCKVLAIDGGKGAQDQAISSSGNALAVYNDILKASIFTAPSIGTSKIHIKDASIFAVSDSVYVIADGQQEISASVISILGNLVELSASIPAKYRETENARLYKVL